MYIYFLREEVSWGMNTLKHKKEKSKSQWSLFPWAARSSQNRVVSRVISRLMLMGLQTTNSLNRDEKRYREERQQTDRLVSGSSCEWVTDRILGLLTYAELLQVRDKQCFHPQILTGLKSALNLGSWSSCGLASTPYDSLHLNLSVCLLSHSLSAKNLKRN